MWPIGAALIWVICVPAMMGGADLLMLAVVSLLGIGAAGAWYVQCIRWIRSANDARWTVGVLILLCGSMWGMLTGLGGCAFTLDRYGTDWPASGFLAFISLGFAGFWWTGRLIRAGADRGVFVEDPGRCHLPTTEAGERRLVTRGRAHPSGHDRLTFPAMPTAFVPASSDATVPTARDSAEPIVRVRHLKTYFPIRTGVLQRVTGWVKAVDDVSFDIAEGETLGLVGESGCGKTTVGRTMLRLIYATSGQVFYKGQDILQAPAAAMKRLRREMQIIFQDPAGSLNPRMRVSRIIGEPLQVHGLVSSDGLRQRVEGLLERCGLPRSAADRYPHEFSGGQRQRIGIARALALEPKVIVCDEPTSALDVSIQSQILNLLKDLQQDFGLSFLFISHDMAVIQHVCQRIAVMYRGRIVEMKDRDSIYDRPEHPYTKSLLSAVPEAKPRQRKQRIAYVPEGDSAVAVETVG